MKRTFYALGIPVLASLVMLGSCNKKETDPQTEQKKEVNDSIKKENKQADLKPAGPAPEWGPSIKPEMAVVIEKLASLGGKPIETLDAKEANADRCRYGGDERP